MEQKFTKQIGFPFQTVKSNEESPDAFIVRGLFTDDNVDMHGDIITKEATKRAIEAFKGWRNIRYMHQPRPVGVAVKIGESEGLRWNELEVDVRKKDVQEDISNGLLRGFSVGISANWEDIEFNEETDGFIINDYVLGEISLVDHPANYAAAVTSVPSKALLKAASAATGKCDMKSIMEYLEENKEMDKNKEVASQEKDVEEEVLDEEIVETEAEQEEVVTEEETHEEENQEIEDEKDIEEEEAEEEEISENEVDDLKEIVASLKEIASILNESVEKFVSTIEEKSAVEVEEPAEDSEQEEPVEEEEVEPEVQEEDAEPNKAVEIDYEKLAEIVSEKIISTFEKNGSGVEPERKAVIPADELEEKENVEKEEKPDLTKVIHRYVMRGQN